MRALARYLEIPARIIDKAPSPDILPGINDEEAIGLSYKELDLILLGLENGWSESESSRAISVEKEYFPEIRN